MERTFSKKARRRHQQQLPDDLIAEILARVSYRSLCRFKCVSRRWLALCSDPGARRKCPKTMSGFFFRSSALCPAGYARVNTSGRGPPMVDPSLSFLPPDHRDVYFEDCCNGLLFVNAEICTRKSQVGDSRYFVCNPATGKWIDLPHLEPMKRLCTTIRLGFDPGVSSIPPTSECFCLCMPKTSTGSGRIES